ncbi:MULTISPECIES: hypothetical protein [Subtercola]|uniref:Uncharacterized protein n=1 Tax=Subtercola vilae TaxID=2056433 RepID=A0A4T2BBC4_9MICO|nr:MULTISPECIES: hypothetical protein [Subtercola]MEA9987205.1 hypothetical protein [Subtercola sp. RTI3]TIH27729.1 hypothetical protein D4765_18545 [Subtercola vilae]
MGDIPGFLASEFPEDARDVPGQEAFTARTRADEEGESAEDAENERDEKQIFYKEDSDTTLAKDDAADSEAEGANPDETSYGSADL